MYADWYTMSHAIHAAVLVTPPRLVKQWNSLSSLTGFVRGVYACRAFMVSPPHVGGAFASTCVYKTAHGTLPLRLSRALFHVDSRLLFEPAAILMGDEQSKAPPKCSGEEADLSIRPLRTSAEFSSCVEAQRRIWGAGFADVAPASLLQISQKVGGLTAGAFMSDDSTLVGFVYGLTGIRDGRLSHWSHMLGVVPEHRGRGIGQKLKHFQRRFVSELGVEEIRWSFDPLMAGNAHFNLNLLQVQIESYEPEMYGETGSDLHFLGTDRFVARWDLTTDHRGSTDNARGVDLGSPSDVRELPLANALPGRDCPDPAFGNPAPRRLRIEIPRDVLRIQEEDPELAFAWRQSTRAAFRQCLRAGYRVAAFTHLGGTERGAYVLEREEWAAERNDG